MNATKKLSQGILTIKSMIAAPITRLVIPFRSIPIYIYLRVKRTNTQKNLFNAEGAELTASDHKPAKT